jgi:hypothetical protein
MGSVLMNREDTERCYAVRWLNPFLGVQHIIETAAGRASTTNGVVWHIELQVAEANAWKSLNWDIQSSHNQDTQPYVWQLFGLWSQNEGLIQSPMPIGSREIALIKHLATSIRAHQDELPFTLLDYKELWLLDEAGQYPLALLSAHVLGLEPPMRKPHCWRGCLESSRVGARHRFAQIDRLERSVRRRAGLNPKGLWVTWDSARVTAKTDEGILYNKACFPTFGISEHWIDEREQALVQSYIDWMAPALLTLPYLNQSERLRLELILNKGAHRVEYYWRLSPAIVDKDRIDTIGIEHRITTANTPDSDQTMNKSL